VIGLAIAARLAEDGREVVVLEAADAIGTGISSRNSEVLHAGLYYPPGSLKARLCVDGNRRLYDWCARAGVAHRRLGKLIVAASDDEVDRLAALRKTAAANGVDLPWLDGAALRALEPALARCAAGLLSPTTGIVDSHGLMLSLQGTAEAHGAMTALRAPVVGGGPAAGGGLRLRIGGASPLVVDCRVAVNAAGLGAPAVSRAIEGVAAVPPLRLCKGSYFDLAGRPPFSHLVYPLPERAGLGVHFTLDLGGRGRFGPDTEWLEEDADPAAVDLAVDAARAAAFQDAIRRYWPDLPDDALRPAYAGLRPKIQGPRDDAGQGTADFVVHTPRETGVEGFFTLYGIESPGLTASLALAEHLSDLIAEHS
jgi:L-2-hydroxyglutarate oxidase LhgO